MPRSLCAHISSLTITDTANTTQLARVTPITISSRSNAPSSRRRLKRNKNYIEMNTVFCTSCLLFFVDDMCIRFGIKKIAV